jgi:hypothetical protein
MLVIHRGAEKSEKAGTQTVDVDKKTGLPRIPFDTKGHWKAEAKLSADDRRDRLVMLVTLLGPFVTSNSAFCL